MNEIYVIRKRIEKLIERRQCHDPSLLSSNNLNGTSKLQLPTLGHIRPNTPHLLLLLSIFPHLPWPPLQRLSSSATAAKYSFAAQV